jgi:hypothetical protein
MKEAGLVVLTLAVSSSVALISLSVQCAAQADCLKRDTCTSVDSWSCSFSTVVDEAAQVLFAGNVSSVARFQALSRGACPPGEAQTLLDGNVACCRARFYPGAANLDAQSPGEAEPHRRYCGRWIDAQTAEGAVGMAFYDEGLVDRQVAEAVVARFSVRSASNAPARFRAACVRTVMSASSMAEARLAFDWLLAKLTASSRIGLLRSVGVLAGHYCDSPAQIALALGRGFRELAFVVTGGTTLNGADVVNDLYALGVGASTRRMAQGFASRVERMQPGPVPDVGEVVHDLRGRWESGDVSHLSKLLAAYEEDPQGADAYLQALAARCSFAARESVFGSASGTARAGLDSLQGGTDRFVAVDSAKLQAATSLTLRSTRARHNIARATRRQGLGACNDAMVTFFPSHVDEAVFDTLVSPTLYRRIGEAYEGVRVATAAALRGGIVGPTLADPDGVARSALGVDLRVAGAPFASWGGKFLPLASPAFTSGDGTFLMLLKAAASLFERRSRLVADGGVCDLPSLYPAATRNAYLFPSARCGMLLPGLLVAPFADALYDEESLYSRVMYVVAHEVAHVTAAAVWRETPMAALLRDYPSSTHVEAIADLTAVVAIMTTGKANRSALCGHLSQLWCARTPDYGMMFWMAAPAPSSHPALNVRGDLMCAFLDRFF